MNPVTSQTWWDGISRAQSTRRSVFTTSAISVGSLVKYLNNGILGQATTGALWVEGTDSVEDLVGVSTGQGGGNSNFAAVENGAVLLWIENFTPVAGDTLYATSGASTLTTDSTSGVKIGSVLSDVRERATAIITFTGVPSDGDYIEFNGEYLYFVTTVNTGNARNEVEIGSLTTAAEFAELAEEVLDVAVSTAGSGTATSSGNNFYIETAITSLRTSGAAGHINEYLYMYSEVGSAANDYTTTVSSSAFSYTQEFTGGTSFYRCYIDIPSAKRTAVEATAYNNQTATYTVLSTDEIVGVNAAAAATVTLPDAATLRSGKQFKIVDESGAASTNAITVDTAGGNINGSTSTTISTDHGTLTVYSNGTNYFIL